MSIIKSADKKKSGGGQVVVRRKVGRPVRSGGSTSNGFAPMQSALEFIQACGGLEQAKAILAMVEQLRSVV